MTLEDLFIEQLMSNKQLLKRGRLIAWRQAEQSSAARREEVCRGGQKKKKLWTKSES